MFNFRFFFISDLKETNQLILLSGVLSIGIGDSAASIVGSKFGRIRFPGTSKTLEGTLVSILAQIIFVCFFKNLNFFVVLSISFVAFVEALTTQVDNVVLPIILYSLLTLLL
jgi:dolichol kinase